MAGPKSFVDKFDESRFGRNIGGVGGGLMALGQVLGAAALGSANTRTGENATQGFARGLAVGVTGLEGTFEKERTKRQDRDFQVFARDQLQRKDLGDRERQMWESVLSGNRSYQALLPSLWSAQNSDAQIEAFKERSAASVEAARLKALGKGAPTPEQLAKDEQTMMARQSLARINADPDRTKMQKVWASMTVESKSAIIEQARRPLVTRDDPSYDYWYEFASKTNPLFPDPEVKAPSLMAHGGYDFTMDGVSGGVGGAPQGDPTKPVVGEAGPDEKGIVESVWDGVTGFFGGDKEEPPGMAEQPDQVLTGLLGAADPASQAASSGASPQPGGGLYEPGVLNASDVSDDVLINSAQPRGAGNGGLIQPGAETNKGRPSPLIDPRDDDMAFSSTINPENTPGKPGWVSPFERRWSAVTRPFRGLMSTGDPNGIRMRKQALDAAGTMGKVPGAMYEDLMNQEPDPGYTAGRKARRDLWRGMGYE